jgi:hypothetical protein
MSDDQRVVVWDPEGWYWEGAIIPESVAGPGRELRGLVALPCEPELFLLGAVHGYFRRSWGSGWPVDTARPAIHCPLVIAQVPERETVHWAARLVPASPQWAKDIVQGKGAGTLRFSPDTARGTGTGALLPSETRAIDGRHLGPVDSSGGWTVGGRAMLATREGTYLSFGLYGAMQGVRVAWAALTLTR